LNHAEFLGIFVIYLHKDTHPLYLLNSEALNSLQ